MGVLSLEKQISQLRSKIREQLGVLADKYQEHWRKANDEKVSVRGQAISIGVCLEITDEIDMLNGWLIELGDEDD